MSKWGTIWAHNKLNIINRSHHSSVAVGAWVQRSSFMALQTEAGLTHDAAHGEADLCKMDTSIVQQLAVVTHCN